MYKGHDMNFINNKNNSIHRKRNKALGVPELIAIALGGMVGGGIFTILGISCSGKKYSHVSSQPALSTERKPFKTPSRCLCFSIAVL